jgi:hypothetical protein
MMNYRKIVLLACVFAFPEVTTAENIDVIPDSWDFGNVLVGDMASTTFTVEADGPAAGDMSIVYGVDIVDDPAGAFTLDLGGSPDFPWVLFMGDDLVPDFQQFDVSFIPPSPGDFSARVTIDSTHVGPIWSVPIEGHSLGIVPEPGSLIVWSLLGLVGVACGWRRRGRS